MEDQPSLISGPVLLRPYTLDDADSLYAAARESLPEMHPWMPWCHPDYAIAESREWVRQCPDKWLEGTTYNLVIADSADGSYLGGCGLGEVDRRNGIANLGYWVRTTRTRRGVATTTARGRPQEPSGHPRRGDGRRDVLAHPGGPAPAHRLTRARGSDAPSGPPPGLSFLAKMC